MALKGYFGVYLTVLSCTIILVQPIHLEANDEPVLGKEFTMICNTSNIAADWYRNNNYIGWSENQYTSVIPDGCKILTDPGRYTFKQCGVNHELTIKSLNYNFDYGSVWSCQSLNDSMNSNNFTILIPGPPDIIAVQQSPIHGQQLTITCNTNMDSVSWYRNGQQLNFVYSSGDVNGCSKGINDIGSLKATKCGYIYNLTIVQVDYYRDSGSVFQCRAGTESAQYTIFVDLYPTFITTAVPVDGNSFDITCFSTFAVSWHWKGVGEDNFNSFIMSSSPNGCSVETKFTDDYELNSCESVNQTLTIKSVDFDRDNGSIWKCSFGRYYDSYTMTVEKQPQIFIQQNGQQLICVYKEDQAVDNIEFLPWRHTIDNKLVREIEGYYINDTVYSLNITNIQNNGGNYTCTVKNSATVQKAFYNFIPKQAPFIYNGNPYKGEHQAGDNCTFSVTYLDDSSLNVSWYHGFQKLETNSRVTIREEPSTISHPYNNDIKQSGIRTILTITSVSISDQGSYSSRICNQHGCSTASFQLAIAAAVEEVGGINVTVTVIVSILAVALLVVGILVVIKCKKYRASKQRENSEQNVYDSTVPTPGPMYDTLGLQNQYENSPSEPPSVSYNTVSGISRT